MAKYTVHVPIYSAIDVEVTAESSEQAIEEAVAQVQLDEGDVNISYEEIEVSSAYQRIRLPA